MSSQYHNHHIVMLPYMAHGHLIPFLGLATQIQQRTNFTITIANTPLNIQYLKSTISSNSSNPNSSEKSNNIRLAELPFCSTHHNLPPNTENTEILHLSQIADFCHASLSLKAPFQKLIQNITGEEGRPPICIISDVFFGWATEVAEVSGTVNVTFSTGGAYGTLAYTSIWQNLPHRSSDSDEFPVPGFPERCLFHRSQLHKFVRAADGTDSWSRFMQPQISLSLKSFGWLCNTAEEIEPLGNENLRKYINLPVWNIGPLLAPALLKKSLSIFRPRSGKTPGISPEKCIDWLNLQSPNSVLYISFGSQNTISATQMMDLAIGLEESKTPFIWVIRPPLGFDIKGEFNSKWLPEGFEERINRNGSGLLVKNWGPQLEILSHKATGGFLSHCGWNSAMESLSQGVPIIGWPTAAEQAYNAKMMVEEMGVCVELTRGVESEIGGEEVKRVIELVMGKNGGKGEEMRKKVAEIGEKIRAAMGEEEGAEGSSVKAMDDFVKSILREREGKSASFGHMINRDN